MSFYTFLWHFDLISVQSSTCNRLSLNSFRLCRCLFIQSFFKTVNEKDSSSSTSSKFKNDDKRFGSSNIVNRAVNNNHVNVVEKPKSFN